MRRLIYLFVLVFCPGFLISAGHAQTATQSVLHSFSGGADGSNPYGGLVLGSDGNFYGGAFAGGANGAGTLYTINSSGAFTTIYNFPGGVAGSGPQTSLTQGSDGNFYGVSSGGAAGLGIIFKVTPGGTFATLYSFTGFSDGGGPHASLVEGSDGNFYGTTAGGGNGYGTIFKVTPAGVLTTLYTFTGEADGGNPYAALVQGSDGIFYGTTNSGDDSGLSPGLGSIFKITPSGDFTTLYLFVGDGNGGSPDAGLVEGSDGNFYGTTYNHGLGVDDDGDGGFGTVFKITPSGTLTTLYQFTGGKDNGHSEGTLILGGDGNFYGTTSSNKGTIFQITPSGTLTTLYSYPGQATGSEIQAGLAQGTDGNLYGTTEAGGANLDGTVFQIALTPALAAPVQLSLSNSTVELGESTVLSWKVLNAFSTTMQRCYASVQNGATGAGNWAGLQTGALSDGVYSGTATLAPTASGTFTYALTCGGVESGFATLTVPPLAIATTSLPNATAGTAYSAPLSVTDGLAPYTWSVTSGSLPADLSLDPASGTISGTPTQNGASSFTVQVQDSESTPATAAANLSLTVSTATPTVTLNAATMNIATPGDPGSATLTVSGFSSDAFSFTCSGLPAGATCNFGTFQGSQAAGTASLEITTTGPLHAQLATPSDRNTPRVIYALTLPGLLAIAGLFTTRRRYAQWRKLCVLLFLLSASIALTACGGSSHSTPASTPSSLGTPAGTSTVTVTATAGSQSATTTLTLTVQ